MYDQHVPRINAAMRACPDTFARGVMFAVLSARTKFPSIKMQLQDLEQKKEKSSHLFSWKLGAYEYLQANKAHLWERTCNAPDTFTAMWELTRIPGLGLVKAAFVLQFLGHDIACLDTRNVKREGRNPRAYETRGTAGTNSNRKNSPAFRALIHRYIAETSGRSLELWDAWCADVADTYLMSPKAVSAIHLVIVPKGFKGALAPQVVREIPF